MGTNSTTSHEPGSWQPDGWPKRKTQENPLAQLTLSLLMLYLFLVPLGNITRFSDEETSLGVTTFVLLGIIILLIRPATHAMMEHRTLFSLALLILWMAFTSIFAYDVPEAYFNLAMFTAYFIAACGIYGMRLTPDRIYRLLQIFAIGGLLSSLATVVDWVGLIHVPHVNKVESGTATEFGNILQASGPFSRRSAMAAYYSLIIPIAFLVPLFVERVRTVWRLVFYATGISCTVALMLTHNRAGVLASFTSIFLILALTNKSPAGFIRASLIVFVLGTVVYGVVASFFPDVLIAYEALSGTGDVASTDTFREESDEMRYILMEKAFSSLLSNPFGFGYSLVEDPNGYGEVDPHNILTQIIWAAGIVGIAWLGQFALQIGRISRITLSNQWRDSIYAQMGIGVFGGLFSFFLVGMAHTIILTGAGWVLFGLLLRITTALLDQKKC